MLPHRVVMLVIAEFCTISGVLVESMTCNGGYDFNARSVGRNREIQLTDMPGFVVVRPVKLPSTESVGSVDSTGSASPIAKQQSHGQITFVGARIFESALLPIFEHEKVR